MCNVRAVEVKMVIDVDFNTCDKVTGSFWVSLIRLPRFFVVGGGSLRDTPGFHTMYFNFNLKLLCF